MAKLNWIYILIFFYIPTTACYVMLCNYIAYLFSCKIWYYNKLCMDNESMISTYMIYICNTRYLLFNITKLIDCKQLKHRYRWWYEIHNKYYSIFMCVMIIVSNIQITCSYCVYIVDIKKQVLNGKGKIGCRPKRIKLHCWIRIGKELCE